MPFISSSELCSSIKAQYRKTWYLNNPFLLGMVNYYSKFMGNLSNTLSPLYKLLQKNVPRHWGEDENAAFKAAKDALSSDTLLIHYDPEKKLILTCDSSPDGVGAVLSHQYENGDRPIAFASRSLNPAEGRSKHNLWGKEISQVSFWYTCNYFH